MSLTFKTAVRLRYAAVTEYKPIIREIEEPGPINARYYEEALTAIRAFHQTGDPQTIRSAIARLDQRAANTNNGRDRAKYHGNSEVLTAYLESFGTPFRQAVDGVPGLFKSFRWEINGLVITGKPHLAVTARNGRFKYIYVSAAKSWDSKDARFAANLLAEIVSANNPAVEHGDIEVLDCRSGQKFVGHELGKRDREALMEMADFLKDRGLN